MSLDTEKLHRLQAKGFDGLYKSNPTKWEEMVTMAVEYAKSYLGKAEILKGDIVAIIQNAIRVDKEFEQHTKTKSLPQKYWVTWFSEYVVEKVYPQPEI